MVEGWISVPEMELVVEQMKSIGDTGTILEIGAAAGRLFNYLHDSFPNWLYVAVDPWEQEQVRLQLDWNKDYFEPDNLGEIISQSMFAVNCPYAETYAEYFESWTSDKKFNIISMGLVSKKINWDNVYSKAVSMLTPDGIIVARNLNHKTYGKMITQSLENLHLNTIASRNGSVALRNTDIKYGSYDINIDVNTHLSVANSMLSSALVKRSGLNNLNSFVNVQPDTKLHLSELLNKLVGFEFSWNFEYFKSGEPAGLHTDYVSIPNTWRLNDTGDITHDCYVVIGAIIPLDWNCKQPYTVNYNKVSNVPRKLIYRKGEMRYMDTNEIVEYRNEWIYDPDVTKFNPIGTQYYKEYADLTLHSVYEWKLDTAMIFDTARWHSSSWFLSKNTVPDRLEEYKTSIIAFGSIDIQREV